MKKSKRHELIRQMIKQEQLGTQKAIQERLEEHGIFVTQTTLSRDLREIGLTKVKKHNKIFYVLAQETNELSMVDFLSRYIEGVARAQFTLVLHTKLGEASVLANVVDGDADKRILGTVAGSNTLLIICKDGESASEIEQAIHKKL